jgi:protein CWC15
MTTAHRPTYVPTKGSATQGGNKMYVKSQQHSSKDLPGNLTLKRRRDGQGNQRDVKKIDFKKELLERERAAQEHGIGLLSSIYADNDFKDNESLFVDDTSELLKLDQSSKKQRLDSVDISEIKSSTNNIQPTDADNVFLQDRDDEFDEGEDKDDEFDDSDESILEEDDDDSEEELMREYEKIKKMREEERREKEKLEAEKLKEETEKNILLGNPLLNTSYSLKKKWYEDTVFKNQAKNEQKVKKRFINDTVRSDFHRKFIAKSIQ